MILTFKRSRLTPNLLSIAFVSIFFGIISLFTPFYIASMLIPIGVFLLSILFGYQIDTENMTMRSFVRYFWFKTGKWRSIKDTQYLTIIRVKHSYNVGIRTIAGQETTYKYRLNLIMKNKKVIPLQTDRQKVIEKNAKEISQNMNLRVFDNVKKDWII